MRRAVATAATVLVAVLVAPGVGESQTWPDMGSQDSGLQWMAGGYLPVSGLGSYGAYEISMDPWMMVGVSVRPGDPDDRFRTRFEISAVPEVAMRRSLANTAAEECPECTGDSVRLSLISSRFLLDLTFPFVSGSRGYLTAGPVMRLQLSDTEICPASEGEECALPEFGRARIDPGLMGGVGWEPADARIEAIQLTGRVSAYGRAAHPDAAPTSWLPEMELAVHFSLQ